MESGELASQLVYADSEVAAKSECVEHRPGSEVLSVHTLEELQALVGLLREAAAPGANVTVVTPETREIAGNGEGGEHG